MKATKRLKDLPGFDEALARAIDDKRGCLTCYDFENVGDAIIPGITRVGVYFLEQIALHVATERMEREARRKRLLRLVPQPKTEAADDG